MKIFVRKITNQNTLHNVLIAHRYNKNLSAPVKKKRKTHIVSLNTDLKLTKYSFASTELETRDFSDTDIPMIANVNVLTWFLWPAHAIFIF